MASKNEPVTKGKIVEAAYKVLGEQGYDKASMKEIAREAGVAQGLINYYFPSKEELLYELFREESCRFCEEMEKLKHIPLSDSFIHDAMKLSRLAVEHHPEWHRLRFELFAIGLRTEAGKQEIADSLKAGRDMAIQAMERLPIGEGVNKQAMSSIVVAALDGLSLQSMCDPEFDAESAYAELAKLLKTYVAANRS